MVKRDNGYRSKFGPSFCANCGDRVTNAGRASRDGTRYCKRPDCRAVKSRLYRAKMAAMKPDRQAPTGCQYCGTPLPERPWRAGDELGRCCRKVSCRAKRDEQRSDSGLDKIPELTRENQRLEAAIFFLMEVIMADADDYHLSNRVVCHTCGLTTAIPGWVHQNSTGGACEGTLNGQKVRSLGNATAMAAAWPFRREYLSADELAAAYGSDES